MTALSGSVLLSGGVLAGFLGIVASLAKEVGRPGPTDPPAALTLSAAVLTTALLAWLCLSLTLALLECLPGRMGVVAGRIAQRLTPSAARRWAALLLGVGLGSVVMPGSGVAVAASGSDGSRTPSTTAVAVPEPGWPTARTPGPEWSPSSVAPVASAATQRQPPPSGRSDSPQADGPGWTPSRPSTRPVPTPDLLTSSRGPATTVDEGGAVVVRRGDTLWDIAARHLGRDATASAIAAEWPRWYEANRELIGSDPDLILPGQRLRPPLAS